MKKLLLIAAMAAVALGASAGYNLEKLWEINDLSFMTTANVRQGFGMNGMFYINDKNTADGAIPTIYEVGQNGLTGVTFEGGANCGISRDEAGNILVSNATFPGSWGEATIKVINPTTAAQVEYVVPEETGLIGRCDFLGFAKGNMFNDGVLYLTGWTNADVYTDGVATFTVSSGEVDVDNCYLALCSGLATNTSTVINYYNDLNGNPALLFAYRSGAPSKLVPDGDNYTKSAIVLPGKGFSNGCFPFVWDGKELFIYPYKGNDATNYLDGWAIAEAGAEEPLIAVPSTLAAAANGFQNNWLNAEVDANGVTIYQYYPGGYLAVYRLTKEADVPNVYMLGGDDQPWDPTSGTMFAYDAENKVYTATVTFPAEFNYFGFTTELAENNDDGGWAYIEPFRFGAIADEGTDFWYDDLYDGQPITLTWDEYHAIRIAGGEYKLTVNLESNPINLVIEKVGGVYIRGDVNMDKSVNIADVTALIDYLLSGSTEGVSLNNADCNLDEGVNIADVTALIDFLLSGGWPAE